MNKKYLDPRSRNPISYQIPRPLVVAEVVVVVVVGVAGLVAAAAVVVVEWKESLNPRPSRPSSLLRFRPSSPVQASQDRPELSSLRRARRP